ncbi:MAG TPA: hypothetical protein VK473_19440, partial [Terriglobales bacterium]|nr:hypothetical protein [Terriglobales bacterium]
MRLIRQSLLLSLMLLASASSKATSSGVVIPAGTRISVRMNGALASQTAKAGDIFSGTLASPIVVNGQTLFPSGSAISGRVVSAHNGAQESAALELALTSVSYQGNSAALRDGTLLLQSGAEPGSPGRVQTGAS